jgi:hypothetical protein
MNRYPCPQRYTLPHTCPPPVHVVVEGLGSPNRTNIIKNKNKQLKVNIWRYLDVTSLCTASLVCHSWHALSSDNRLWVPRPLPSPSLPAIL